MNEPSKYDEVIDETVELLNAFVKRKDIFDVAAKAVRASYEALIRVGFTEEQAMDIVSRQGAGFKK